MGLSGVYRSRLEIRRLAAEWRYWCSRIGEAARNIFADCRVYVFGSVVRGEETGGSDVDILLVCKTLPDSMKERGELKAKLEEVAGLPLYHPFEIHLATEQEVLSNPVYRSALREAVEIQ